RSFSSLFFFSSRRRHTRFSRDWSSDVCSSDLYRSAVRCRARPKTDRVPTLYAAQYHSIRWWPGLRRRTPTEPTAICGRTCRTPRSEERRVGKECRSRWWACQEKKKSVIECVTT